MTANLSSTILWSVSKHTESLEEALTATEGTVAAETSTLDPPFDFMPLINLNRSLAEPSILTSSLPAGVNSPTSTLVFVLVSSALVCLILATIIGNVFVISAIIIERTLRTVGNYLVLSLAVTDLLVAMLVMPIGAIYEVTQEWRLGTSLCELWTFIDVLCCTASIFHLLAIACDRFWAVTTVDYIHRRKGKHVCAGIGLIWVLSAVISLGPMLGWKDSDFENRIVDKKLCLVSQAMSYQVFATIFSFYAPSILLLLLYYRIYQVAKTRILLKKQRYKYRIRRRPSFYRPRKSESEIKELPSAASACLASHRSSLNPTSTDDYFSSSAIPGTSSSGVYSSSTTDYPTTNTTFTSETSPNSLSPLAIVMSEGVGGNLIPPDFNPHHKRMSLQQFLAFQQQKQSDMCEQYVLSAHQIELPEGHHGEKGNDTTSIMVTVPPPNIVVYVDDFTSALCEVSEERVDSTNKDYSEELDEEDGVISLDETTAAFKVDELPEEDRCTSLAEDNLRQVNGSESGLNGSAHNGSNGQHKQTGGQVGGREAEEHRRVPSSKKSTRSQKGNSKTKKLQFRNKITQYESHESKQESKAAKTLTIITGVFIMCWLPFFVIALVMPLCKDCVINKYFFDFCLWLGWANSSVNPFLYTIFSPDFRNAFKKLIFGQKRRPKKRK